MALIDMIRRSAGSLRSEGPASGQDGHLGPRAWGFGGGAAYSAGMRITAESIKRIACAQACVSIIGRNIGSMPVKVFSEETRGSKRLATNCPEYRLLYSRPNDRHTAVEFKQTLQGHFELHGNGYAEKKMDRRGTTQQLLPMHPNRVTPEVLQSGRMRYKYADPLTNSTRILVQEEVFHLRNWSDDGYVGQSTMAMGADVFGVALAAQDYTSRFFQNDAKPSLYFQSSAGAPKFKSEQDKEEFRENWRKAHTGGNRHKVAFVPPGMELKSFGVDPAGAQLLEARKFSRIEICSLFGVPPHLVGETEKAATYASVEQFNIMFAVQCLLPRVITWEQAIQRDILEDESFSAKFSMAALLRGDNGSRTAAYAVAIQNGWMSQNDVRILEDQNPIEDGDTYWRPLAWAPLGQINVPKAPGAKGQQEEGQDELDQTGADAVAHNAYILGALADKSPAEVTKALLEMK